jgi:soluble lytic murein transglycosylase
MKKIIAYFFLASSVIYFLFYLKNNDVMLLTKNPYSSYINEYSTLFSIDKLLIKTVMKKESNLNPDAVSKNGAIGLMQLMPKTAFESAEKLNIIDCSYNKIKEPKINIMFGVYYLKNLLNHYDNNLILALAAYNAGIGKVDNWCSKNPKIGEEMDMIPFKETKCYVKSIISTYKIYRILYAIKWQFRSILSEVIKKSGSTQPIMRNQFRY